MSNEISIVKKYEKELASLDKIVSGNGLSKSIDYGTFTAAFERAQAMKDLTETITDEMMKPVMYLMNKKLGFLTDKTKERGDKEYSVHVVKNAVIEATLRGFQIIGNQFNIIAGNFYATKEGLEYLLNKSEDLKYETIFGIPQVHGNSAHVESTIKGSFKGDPFEITRIYPIRVNKGMGDDALIGKAKRRIYGELYSHITGTTTTIDGDVDDIGRPIKEADATVVEGSAENEIAEVIIEAASTSVVSNDDDCGDMFKNFDKDAKY